MKLIMQARKCIFCSACMFCKAVFPYRSVNISNMILSGCRDTMTLGSAHLLTKVSTYEVQQKIPTTTFRLKKCSLSLGNSKLKLIKIKPINLFRTSIGRLFLHRNTYSLTLFRRLLLFFFGNNTKHINTRCWQNGKLFNVNLGRPYSYHWALKS